MSAEAVIPGYTEAVIINGERFPRIACSYRIEKSVFNNRDDVSGPYHKSKVDGLKMTGQVQFQLALDLNPHAAPFSLVDATTDTVVMDIYPRGLNFPPYSGIFTVTNYNSNSNAQNGPVGGTFDFESYGPFTLPP